MTTKRLSVALALVILLAQHVHAENWVPVTGSETLRNLVSDATAEIEVRPGVTVTGTYNADGTAEIEAWGESFARTWEVFGDEQVCYSTATETNCFTFEQDQDSPGSYRARHVETGETYPFRVSDSGVVTVATRAEGAGSEGSFGTPSAEEMAAQMSNPNANLGTLTALFNYVTFDGEFPDADSASGLQGIFQPSLPYALNETTNLFVRPAIPVIFKQDVPNANGGFDSKGIDLGDISFDASVLKSTAGGAIYGGGIVGSMPTASNDALGLDQWLLGPEVIGAIMREWGVLGLLVFHQWDVAGSSDFDTSITGGQAFYVFNLKGGWQLMGTPAFSYDHEASSGNEWTVPIGIGFSKTTIINGRPWQFGVEYQHYVKSPDVFGPDWQIQFMVSPVVSLPW